MDNRNDLVINILAEQRNEALDRLVAVRAEALMLQARVKELEAEVAQLNSELAAKAD